MSQIYLRTFALAIILGNSISSYASQWQYLTSDAQAAKNHASVSVLSSSATATELLFTLDGFSKNEVPAAQRTAYTISSTDLTPILEAGAPDLGKMAFSLVVPDQASMVVDELNSTYTSYLNVEVAPSKGNLYRNQDPSSIPYTYGASYSQNAFYPGQLVQLQSPYIVRDFRGLPVWVFPFQYNPVTKELRVYTEIRFKVRTGGNTVVNPLIRTKPLNSIDPTFGSIYRSIFVNPNSLLYTPLSEEGSMLVICYDAFFPAMQPFVDWKNKMGLPTEMVPFSSVGTSVNDLKNYIANYYNTSGLTFVLLVGDGDQIPVASTSNGESDPSLGYLVGNDSYAEVIVGRFSAETIEEVETQVSRTIAYEAFPDPSGAWYQRAVCIGSNQGPGDDNEMDYEHERNMRTDELNYTYTDADELYDGTHGGMDANGDPSASDLVASINDGRGIITYTGHGSCGAFSTTGFSNNDVPSLTNADRLPFIWSVACVNGQFNGYDCLAEAFLRARDVDGKATGAVATLMSTINQSWDPPMDAQDEFIDLLTEQYGPTNMKRTFGGISVNGCMHMNDQYGAAGDEMTDTWTCFGDPSLMLRTATPSAMTVAHDLVIDESATSFMVNCNTDGALICLSKSGQILSTHHALLNFCNLQNISGLTVGDTLDVTATAFNKIPYTGKVVVTSLTAISDNTLIPSTFTAYPTAVSSGSVTLQYSIPSATPVYLDLVNSLGEQVMMISHGEMQSGERRFDVDLKTVPAGVYTFRLHFDGNAQTKKIVIF